MKLINFTQSLMCSFLVMLVVNPLDYHGILIPAVFLLDIVLGTLVLIAARMLIGLMIGE